ncbi:hypothetical protein C8039_16475 [Halogeometricum sp. wsp3]|nr:hypothetical protein C8039_16475 [Halogeometricum sp. wsp3]
MAINSGPSYRKMDYDVSVVDADLGMANLARCSPCEPDSALNEILAVELLLRSHSIAV